MGNLGIRSRDDVGTAARTAQILTGNNDADSLTARDLKDVSLFSSVGNAIELDDFELPFVGKENIEACMRAKMDEAEALSLFAIDVHSLVGVPQ